MVAIIGGDPRRFAHWSDCTVRRVRAGHAPEHLRVGMHALGYVAPTLIKLSKSSRTGYIEGLTEPVANAAGAP